MIYDKKKSDGVDFVTEPTTCRRNCKLLIFYHNFMLSIVERGNGNLCGWFFPGGMGYYYMPPKSLSEMERNVPFIQINKKLIHEHI